MAALKWYTRARKFPQLIGRTPDGTRIPGGPYTFLQVGAGAAVVAVMTQTTGLWARGDMISNVVILIAVSAAVVFFTGKLPPGARSPLFIVAGLTRLLSRGQRLEGRQVRVPKLAWVADPTHIPTIEALPPSQPPVQVETQRVAPVAAAAPAPPLSAVQRLLTGGVS